MAGKICCAAKAVAIALTAGRLLAAHGWHAYFRFDLGHGTGKKSR